MLGGNSAFGSTKLRLTRSMRKNARGAHSSTVADARQVCTVKCKFEYELVVCLVVCSPRRDFYTELTYKVFCLKKNKKKHKYKTGNKCTESQWTRSRVRGAKMTVCFPLKLPYLWIRVLGKDVEKRRLATLRVAHHHDLAAQEPFALHRLPGVSLTGSAPPLPPVCHLT